jgi:hypothetical protein
VTNRVRTHAESEEEHAFFVHGLRRRGPEAEKAARRLRPGDGVALEPEPDNPADPEALRVLTRANGTHLGFVPRYLCRDVHQLREACGDEVRARVRRVNPPPTPAQFRVLCTLEAPWPRGFDPVSAPDFEPLHELIPAVRP